jgi:hypothetical protein
MPRLSLRDALKCVDSRVRFDLRPDGDAFAGGRVSVESLLRMRRIPHDWGTACYEVAEDDDSRICIVISPPEPCDDHEAWLTDQLAHPVMRSHDRVDIFGNLIEESDHV